MAPVQVAVATLSLLLLLLYAETVMSIPEGSSVMVYKSPLGACEVEGLSLKRMKREIRKRGTECVRCTDKTSYGKALIVLINIWAPALSDTELSFVERSLPAERHPWNTETATPTTVAELQEEFANNPPAELLAQGDDAATPAAAPENPDAWKTNYLSRIVAIFQVYDPPAIKTVARVLAAWKGREEALIDSLIKKYNAGAEAKMFRTPQKRLAQVLASHGVSLSDIEETSTPNHEDPIRHQADEL